MLICLLPDLNELYNAVLVTFNSDADFTDLETKFYARNILKFNSYQNLTRSEQIKDDDTKTQSCFSSYAENQVMGTFITDFNYNKKKILIVIDSLARGGAETMLVNLLKPLSEDYSIILVTLSSKIDFFENEIICDVRLCLNYDSMKGMLWAIMKLKKIIKKHKPDLVHCQLFWSTIIGRFSVPKSIPFIFSIHSQLSQDAFKANKFARILEKLTYNKRHNMISVSNAIFKDYATCIGIKGRHFILNNFVQEVFFKQQFYFSKQEFFSINLIAVGNLKTAKNYFFLLNVIKEIKNNIQIKLDIIGDGHLRIPLQEFIDQQQLPVTLLGQRNDVESLLPHYNLFIMCSFHEGFGNAPVEAMAIGLPLILNDLEVMKEMSMGNALFYESGNEQSLAELLLNLPKKKQELVSMSEKGKLIAKENYALEQYVKKLKNIYEIVINESNW